MSNHSNPFEKMFLKKRNNKKRRTKNAMNYE